MSALFHEYFYDSFNDKHNKGIKTIKISELIVKEK